MTKNEKIEQFSQMAETNPAQALMTFIQESEPVRQMDHNVLIAMAEAGLEKSTGQDGKANAVALGFFNRGMEIVDRAINAHGLEPVTQKAIGNLITKAEKLAAVWSAFDENCGRSVKDMVRTAQTQMNLSLGLEI